MGVSYVIPIGSLHADNVCNNFMSLVRTFEIVSLLKLTTNNAVPSDEIAKLRAALPVLTVLPGLFASKSHDATRPDKFIVTYNIELSGDKTIARGLLPIGMYETEKSSRLITWILLPPISAMYAFLESFETEIPRGYRPILIDLTTF